MEILVIGVIVVVLVVGFLVVSVRQARAEDARRTRDGQEGPPT